jgi:predicted GTPase
MNELSAADKALLDEINRILGPDLASMVTKDDLLQEVFRRVPWLGEEPLQVCLVGSTGVGKSTLVNALFAGRIAKVLGLPDTTDAIQKVRLLSGVVLIDTPGLGGFQKTSANLT